MKKRLIVTCLCLSCLFLWAQDADTLKVLQGKMKSPALAIGLSTVFPGGGQFYNQKWLKGTVFLGAEAALGGMAAYYYYDNWANPSSNSLNYAKQYTWFFAAVYAYSLMDAYVDAHLSNFPDEGLILEPNAEIKGVKLSLSIDEWLRDGKWMHLASSYFLTLQSAYTLNEMLNIENNHSRYISAGIGLSFSLGSEIFDKNKAFSWENVLYDALGVGLAYLTGMAIQGD